ncbi:diguanylate cyclase domain-containing protein [Zavarzinia sp. CC-PAN008]|uniref:GGDEF domain-containing protein n=1 Tax=Zavarzinia sp. CC-PAN008 TaxID=3243332 RepID=UPI003F7463BB
MAGQVFIALLNPGIGLLLAGAFGVLWLYRRDQVYVRTAAWAYGVMAVAFVVQDFAPRLPYDVHRIPSNLGFLAAAALLTAAMMQRARVAVPWRLLLALGGVTLGAMVWFLLVQPDLGARIWVMSWGFAAYALVMAVGLARAQRAAAAAGTRPRLIDRLMVRVTVLAGLLYALRPLALAGMPGGAATQFDLASSVYWAMVQSSQAMLSILLALVLMVAFAVDRIGEARAEADTDPLSGLLNRRGFEAAAQAALRRAATAGVPAALMIADLDHFKRINDSHGHAVGDAVIALFGAHVRDLIGVHTIAGRIGGEEFAILLPAVDLGGARRLADQLCRDLPAWASGRVPDGLRPTVSVGLAVGLPGTTLAALLARADRALYDAKQAGRDQVRVFLAAKGEDSAPPRPASLNG